MGDGRTSSGAGCSWGNAPPTGFATPGGCGRTARLSQWTQGPSATGGSGMSAWYRTSRMTRWISSGDMSPVRQLVNYGLEAFPGNVGSDSIFHGRNLLNRFRPVGAALQRGADALLILSSSGRCTGIGCPLAHPVEPQRPQIAASEDTRLQSSSHGLRMSRRRRRSLLNVDCGRFGHLDGITPGAHPPSRWRSEASLMIWMASSWPTGPPHNRETTTPR